MNSEERPKKGFIQIDDPRMSGLHFEIEVDSDGNFLNIVDLGSNSGTWLVILNYLEDMVEPEIEYQNEEVGAFKFVLGTLCYTLEEIFEMYEEPEVLSDFCFLGLFTLEDIREIKPHELETRISKAMLTPERQQKSLAMLENIRRDFSNDKEILKNRIIMRVLTGVYRNMEVEIGYRGSKIGVIENNNVKTLVYTSYQHSDTFDENLFDVNFKAGKYFLKSYGTSRIFKKFASHEKHELYPGHRICAGSQVFTLLQ